MNQFHWNHVPQTVDLMSHGFEFDGMIGFIIKDDVDDPPGLTLDLDQQTDSDQVAHDLTPLDGLPES